MYFIAGRRIQGRIKQLIGKGELKRLSRRLVS